MWTRGGMPISDNNIVQTVNTITFNRARREDTGTYTIFGNNTAGSDSATFDITVNCKWMSSSDKMYCLWSVCIHPTSRYQYTLYHPISGFCYAERTSARFTVCSCSCVEWKSTELLQSMLWSNIDSANAESAARTSCGWSFTEMTQPGIRWSPEATWARFFSAGSTMYHIRALLSVAHL